MRSRQRSHDQSRPRSHRLSRLVSIAFLASLGAQTEALAHGVAIEYQQIQAVAIQANYDSGEPMKNAQVAVYAPNNPEEPWTTGTTNEQGEYLFTPDPALSGNWEITVRQAGHGEVLTIPIAAATGNAVTGNAATGNNDAAMSRVRSGSQDNLTPVQKAVLGGSVIWGFVGTALFFSRGKK